MKGQIFVLASVMILIVLLMLQNSIRPFELKDENSLYENFVNIKGELIRTVDVSLINQEGVSSNLEECIGFSKDVMGRKGYTEQVMYSVSTYGNTTVVQMNFTLSLGNSFIEDNFIINRTVHA